jgi:hypothetical protein
MAVLSGLVILACLGVMWLAGFFKIPSSATAPAEQQQDTVVLLQQEQGQEQEKSSNFIIAFILRHQSKLLIGLLATLCVVAASVALYYVNRGMAAHNSNGTPGVSRIDEPFKHTFDTGNVPSSTIMEDDNDRDTLFYGLIFTVATIVSVLVIVGVVIWRRESLQKR